jgi:hypothetical protein
MHYCICMYVYMNIEHAGPKPDPQPFGIPLCLLQSCLPSIGLQSATRVRIDENTSNTIVMTDGLLLREL